MKDKIASHGSSHSSPDPEWPEDIKACWLNVARRAQSACYGNNGLGLMTITVAVSKNNAIMWLPPTVVKVEPASLAREAELDASVVVSLAALMSKNGHKT